MRQDSVRRLVLLGMFVALTLLLGMTPLGLIPLGFINVTILCVPVIIGTVVLGLKSGMVLGACFGLASTLSAFGMSWTPPSALASALVAASPLLAVIMCFVPRLCVPLVTHLVFRLVGKGNRATGALPVAAAAGSLTNTVLYLGLMLLFYVLVGIDSTGLLAVIGGTGLIAGGSEAVVAAILATPITVALWKIQKKPV